MTNADGAQFLQDARWAKCFIPTITHALYISREPFRDWTSESPTFLATVQTVFNISFTNVTFLLSSGDPIVDTVRLWSLVSSSAALTDNDFAGLPTGQVTKVKSC
jgi:hypothetical protein